MGTRISFYMDEHVARAVVLGLRNRGVDVRTVPEARLLGAKDAFPEPGPLEANG